ncbi:MAG: PAS domain S-box protein [Syntrophobacteraceae bacterium]
MDDEIRILILEDRKEDSKLIERELRNGGLSFEALVVETEDAYIRGIDEFRPRLILGGYRLPAFDGLTALSIAVERCPCVPFILVSGTIGEDLAVDAMKQGATDYVLKQRLSRLVPVVRRALKEAETQKLRMLAEQELHRVNRLYNVLSQVNQAIVRVKSKDELLSTVCRLVVERGTIDLAWIGWLDPETSSIHPIASFGQQTRMLTEANFYASGYPEGQGNLGKAIREGKSFVCDECDGRQCLYPTEQAPVRFGFQSCGSFPLRFQGDLCGALTLCVAEKGFFHEREIELLEEVAADVSFALDKIEGDTQRDRLREKFEHQSTFLQILMDAIPDPVFYKDTQLRYLGCNRAFERVIGMDRDQTVGKRADGFWHKDLADIFYRTDRELLANTEQQTLVFEWTLQNPDGTRTDFLNRKAVFRNKDGTPGGIIGVMVDITDRKRTEDNLRENEERFRAFFENAAVGAAELDQEGRFVTVNEQLCRITGYDESELLGMAVSTLSGSADLESERGHLMRYLQGEAGDIYDVEKRYIRKNGDIFWVQVAARLIFDSNGRPIRSAGLIMDITERKAAEAALRKAHELALWLGRFPEENPNPVVRVSLEGIVLYRNPVAAELPGWACEAGRPLPDDLLALFRQTVEEGQEEPPDIELNGRIFSLTVAPFDAEGYANIYGLDITGRRRSELARSKSLEQQRRLNQLQQALLGPGEMSQKLKMITGGVVEIFGADFCRIWRLGPGDLCEHGCVHASVTEGPNVCKNRDQCLHLMSSSGRYTHTDGATGRRVPLGAYKIGLVASGREHRFLTNDVVRDPRIDDREWARELGLVSFAAYQIRPPDGETLGVLALFSKQAISPEEDAQLDSLSTSIARLISAAQADEALKDEVIRRRILFEQSRDGIAVIDQNGKVTEANQSFADMLGYSVEEVHQLHVWDWDAERTREQLEERFRRNFIPGERFERRHRRRDGTVFDVEVCINGVVVAGEKLVYCVHRDISERKAAVAAIQESEWRFRAISDSAQDAIILLDKQGTITFWNPAAERIFKYSADEAEGQNAHSLLAPQRYLDAHFAAFREFAKTGRGQVVGKTLELFALRKGGEEFPIELSLSAFRMNDLWHAAGIVRDITGRKRVEQELRDSEERLKMALTASRMGVWEWNVRTGNVFLSPQCYDIFGIKSFDEKIGSLTNLIHPEDRAGTWMKIDKALRDRTVYRDEFRIIQPGAGVRWVSGLGMAEYDPDGEPLRLIGIMQDITERKQLEKERNQAEAKLRQAQKLEALGTLAGGVAHDFNNILGIIVGYTEISKMELGKGSPIANSLQEVLKASKRAKELVQQILAFCRRSDQQRMPVQIELIVNEAMRMLRSSLPSTIEVKTDLQTKALALADPSQIHQVLMNLCTNAAHAMPDGGVLEVSLTEFHLGPESIQPHSGLQPGQYLKLTVKDTGHGIPPAIIDRIFDPFFTTKETGEGTGLGLSVVHGIVESHGGTIKVNSFPGDGTSFTVLLPARESASASQKVEAASLIPRGKEHILVVDDEPALGLILKRTLEDLGYTVDCRTSGIDALVIFRRQQTEKPFDLVITDMTMPELTGTGLARKLYELQQDLPIILLTGYSRKIDAEMAKSLGIQGFLMKPVPMEELARTVRTVLDQRTK